MVELVYPVEMIAHRLDGAIGVAKVSKPTKKANKTTIAKSDFSG